MISSSEATLPRSRCKIRSATRRARARQRLSECARARVPARRRIGRPRCCGALRCSRCNRRGSRGRAGTADSGKRARIQESRNRRARRGPRRRSSDHDISATWDQARCVFARRVPFSSSAPALAGEGDHPAQQGGGGGAGGDETLTTTGNHRCEIHSNVFQRGNKKPICILSLSTTTKRHYKRPLHHGSLAARAPVVPLPRFAGADARSRSRDATAPEFCGKNESH
jgi:hypothetical protein